jgi:hypothetical protein
LTLIFLYISTKNKSQKLTILFKLCTNKNHSYKHNEQINNQDIDNSECFGKLWKNKNHSYKHNEQINNQNIDNSECFGIKFVKIYPEMTSQ